MGINTILPIIAGVLMTTLVGTAIGPSVIEEIKVTKVENLTINNQELIAEGVKRYITIEKKTPINLDEVISKGYLSSSINNNGFGEKYEINIDKNKGLLNITTIITDPIIQEIFLNNTESEYTPTKLEDNKFNTSYILPLEIMHGSDDLMATIPIQNTPPCGIDPVCTEDNSKFWYDTSGGEVSLKGYDDNSKTWKIISDGSENGVYSSTIPNLTAEIGDKQYSYDSTTNIIQEYIYVDIGGIEQWVPNQTISYADKISSTEYTVKIEDVEYIDKIIINGGGLEYKNFIRLFQDKPIISFTYRNCPSSTSTEYDATSCKSKYEYAPVTSFQLVDKVLGGFEEIDLKEVAGNGLAYTDCLGYYTIESATMECSSRRMRLPTLSETMYSNPTNGVPSCPFMTGGRNTWTSTIYRTEGGLSIYYTWTNNYYSLGNGAISKENGLRCVTSDFTRTLICPAGTNNYNSTQCKKIFCPNGYSDYGSSSTCRKLSTNGSIFEKTKLYNYGSCVSPWKEYDPETCYKKVCPEGYSDGGMSCYKEINTYTCPVGYTDNGTNCKKTILSCPFGYIDNGTNCEKPILACPFGYTDNGTNCKR